MSINVHAIHNYFNRPENRLLVNMLFPDSPGHMICELDNFMRMRHLGEIPENLSYYAVFPSSVLHLPSTIATVLPKAFAPESGIQVIIDDEIYKLANDISLARPELAIDPGLSHIKVVLGSEEDRKKSRLMYYSNWPRMYWIISNKMLLKNTTEWYRRRKESADYCFLAGIPSLSSELQDFLGGNVEKLALIHIRSSLRGAAGNAGTFTEPELLMSTLGYLRDMGYTIVKIGLEPYPESWAHFSVINYSESSLRNYTNDLILLKAAKFVMMNATGFEAVSDILGTPMVSYGRWSLAMLPCSRNCVNLPSLMRSKANGCLLKFKEQIDFYLSLPELWQKNVLGFPTDEFDERPPTADEFLAATQEAIALGENFVPMSAEQEKFLNLDRKWLYADIQSRFSQQFLERFSKALETGFIEDK